MNAVDVTMNLGAIYLVVAVVIGLISIVRRDPFLLNVALIAAIVAIWVGVHIRIVFHWLPH